MPNHATQIVLEPLSHQGASKDRFIIDQADGRVRIRASDGPAMTAGLNWYLKYVAAAHFSWAGDQAALPPRLPLPDRPIAKRAQVKHRYYLNDTDDGYSGPYRTWADWERLIDRIALQGATSMLVTVGQEAVYHRMFREFGYTDEELRRWIPAPAHQPWWLLQNMAGFGGPVSPRLLAARVALGQRIVARLRALGIAPVFPGYFGTVPPGFAERNPGTKVIPQGKWVGFDRPDWLDPTSSSFKTAAASFYHHQQQLFGPAVMYKIDLLHEGGQSGGIDVTAAARAVQGALDRHRADAVWVMLGWQKNPSAKVLAGADKARTLVVDGLSDRHAPAPDRDKDWGGHPYAFGSIANFGGHTTIGAKTHVWTERFGTARSRTGSALHGIAWMPEGGYRDAAAMEMFGELAWREEPITDPAAWFADYARFRYGGEDNNARAAWRALGQTAYKLDLTEFSEPADSLFAARPSLDIETAAAWSPEAVGYDSARFETALAALLRVAPRLRRSDAYKLDLVDVGRQCLANRARRLIVEIRMAFEASDLARLDALRAQWLAAMDLSDTLLATHRHFLLGPWLASARAAGGSRAESDQFEYDARTILTVWGPRAAADGGKLRDYANREWAGLVGGLYRERWRVWFDVLADAIRQKSAPRTIDWFALEDAWTRQRQRYAVEPRGSAEAVAGRVAAFLAR